MSGPRHLLPRDIPAIQADQPELQRLAADEPAVLRAGRGEFSGYPEFLVLRRPGN